MRLWHRKAPQKSRPARPRMTVIATAVGLALAAGISSAAAAGTAEATISSCRAVQVPVNIPGVSTPGQITGDYCVPRVSNGYVLLMVAGGAENAAYWNMPGLSNYSLTEAAAREGYATFAIDRLGTGRSTIPSSSTLVTYAAQVSTVNQVDTALRRDPALFGHEWDRIIGMGHSLGSGTIVGVAAAYPADFNALVITGYGPEVSPETAQLNALYQVPASTVTSVCVQPSPCTGVGYLTVLPSGIADSGLFYDPGTSPAALAAAAQYEGLLSKTELLTRPQGAAAEAQGALIKVPVLVVDGQYDRHYCEDNPINEPPSIGANCATQQAFNAYETPLFPNACLATSTIAQSGHAIQEEKAAPWANRLYLNWLHATLLGRTHCATTGVYANFR